MKTNVKKLLKKYLTNKQLFKHFGLLCFVPLFFSSCAGRKFISEAKWKDKHIVYFKTNQENVTVKNKKGEKLEQASDGELTGVYIDKLRPKNLKLTLSHPNRADTTIKIKRSVRAGALFFDCTFGAILCGIPLIVDFADVNIYQVKKSSRNLTVNMLYNDQYYERKLYEAKQKGNIAAFEEFIKNYPESKFVIEAQNSVYSLAWKDANIKNTIPAYDDFIAKYPKATQVTEAQDKVYTIAYASAVNANTQAAFDDYIAKYPNAPNIETAKQTRAKVKQIDDAYAAAKTSGTYNAYKDFLTNYEGTKYTADIATKALDAYYTENINNYNTLANCNQATSIISQYVTKYHINFSNKLLDNIVNKRDQLIIEKLQLAETKENYISILKDQSKAERLNESDDLDINGIKERVFNNTNCRINGTFNLWTVAGEKVVASYQNNKLNGAYTKYAADEKTVLEKGTYEKGNKTGAYLVNFENGKKHYNQNYDNGSMQNEVEYNESGKIVYEEGLFEGFYESDNYDMSDLVVCFKNTSSGFKPTTNKLCFVENSNTLSRIIEFTDSVIGNHSLLKKIQFKIKWKTIIDDGSTMHYAKDYKHYVITSIDMSEEMQNTLTTEVEKAYKLVEQKKKEANEPKLGVNYWITKENHSCSWCGKNYVRTKTKYASTEVMVAAASKELGIFDFLAPIAALNFTLTQYKPDENYCSKRCENHL